MRRILVTVLCAAGVGIAPAAPITSSAAAAAPTAAKAAAAWPIVKPAPALERVRVIQYLLNARGARLVVDGVFAGATTTAVKNFQRKNRLVVDGHVGPATWKKLIVTVRTGSRGAAVSAVQHQLRFQYRYRTVSVNGVFDHATTVAVLHFQTVKGLPLDGVVGSATWQALES